jgi:fatty acid desaturase
MIPAMLIHGIVMAFLFAPMHETSHGTAFRSRWLNEAVFRLISFIYISPPVFFRYFHAAHHSYTQIRGRDPDIVMPEQPTIFNYIVYVSTVRMWRRNATWFVTHALGHIDPRDSWYVPESEWPRIYREARVMLAMYAAIGIAAYTMGTVEILTLWLIPRLMGEPVMRWIRVTEHVGCEYTADLRRNTRTTRPSLLLRGIFWNMSYHAEHHLCPAVPFHALAALHREAGHQLHEVGSGYLAVHREVLTRILAPQLGRLIKPGRLEASAR